jgi:hypothetical protein
VIEAYHHPCSSSRDLLAASRHGKVAVRLDASAAVVEVIASHSYPLPHRSGSQINNVDLNPCSPTIGPLDGSHDKVNGAPRQPVRIWSTEGHRFNRCAVQRERQACMAAISH